MKGFWPSTGASTLQSLEASSMEVGKLTLPIPIKNEIRSNPISLERQGSAKHCFFFLSYHEELRNLRCGLGSLQAFG